MARAAVLPSLLLQFVCVQEYLPLSYRNLPLECFSRKNLGLHEASNDKIVVSRSGISIHSLAPCNIEPDLDYMSLTSEKLDLHTDTYYGVLSKS